MAITSGYFNSVNGDRKYNADQMSEYFDAIVNQGVFQHYLNGLAVSAGTGLSVSVATGKAVIQSKWVKNDAAVNLTISAASTSYARIDAVVIRLSSSNRTVTIAVKDGTPSANPSAPSMTRAGGTYEMALAYVNVAANATSVTVTDKRSDTSVCGWATVAQETSGEVDAMLEAMKTGFDGEVYDSPGAAVRGSDSLIASQISKFFNDGLNYYRIKYEQGSINTNTGDNVATSSAIRSQYIQFTKDMLISCEAGYKYNIFYYQTNGTYIGSAQNKQGTFIIDHVDNAGLMRFRIVKSNGSDITPEEHPALDLSDMSYNTSNTIIFDTVADMVNYPFTPYGAIFRTKGYYSKGDGGGAYYKIDVTSGDLGYTAPHINIQLANGRFARLIYSKTLYAKQIGCKAYDSTFDNSVIVNEVTNNSHFENSAIVFEKGDYYFDYGILDTNSVDLIGEFPINYYSYDKNKDCRLIFKNVIDQTYYAAIYCNHHVLISNLFIYGLFVTYTEDRSQIGLSGEPDDSWLTFSVTKENTTGIRDAGVVSANYNCTIQNCVVRGFSTGITLSLWTCVRDCLIMECDGYAIRSSNDNQISGCRIQYCGYGILGRNLNMISDIRMDSIRYIGIDCNGSNAIISNIHGDYIGQCLIRLDSISGLVASSIAGRCGVNYVNAENNMSESDKLLCSLILLEDTSNISMSAINGRIRELDDGVLLSNTKAISLNDVDNINISLTIDSDADLTEETIQDVLMIGSDDSCSGGIYMNGCLYRLISAISDYSNIYKSKFESI